MEHEQTPHTPLSVRTSVFEGPLELLLELVEKRKLLINDISLAEVTDEYMSRVAQMQEESLPNTAQFVALAATLLLLKSRSLLPVLTLTEEEEESIDDLEQRLQLYKIYRDAALVLTERFGTAILHRRQYTPSEKPLFTTDEFTTTEALAEAMQRVIHNLPVSKTTPKVRTRPTVSLEEMISRLEQRIEQQLQLNFSELIEHNQEKTLVIVGFLAVLESVKQGRVLVQQEAHFSDIAIRRESVSTPHYRA